MRASTVMRSIPTRDTRTQASMTIPLSRTRSRTSIRLVPPAARSTGIDVSHWFSAPHAQHSLQGAGSRPAACDCRKLALKHTDFLSQFFVLGRERLLAWRQVVIELPPVEPNLFSL